jgi:WD40 repeat protein
VALGKDLNLLFGILAVQLRLVTPQQLASAGAVWATQQERELGAILVEQGVLAEQQRQLISTLLQSQVSSHQGDAAEVLDLFGGEAAVQASFAGSLVYDRHSGEARYASINPAGLPATPLSTPRADSPELSDPSQLTAEHPSRYDIRSEQGRGGVGRVFVAYDSHIQREIALKELLGERSAASGASDGSPHRRNSTHTARFLREARITGQLEHPGIVPVYELGQRADGTVYYTMKLVRGDTLGERLRRCKTLAERLELLPHFLDLCQAIAYAHSRGVIHRDIKPANVMVGEFGETLLLDWGLAKVRGQADHGAEKLADEVRQLKEAGASDTVDGKPIGTPSYMPPEQADGRIADVDERSDVWSLGAVLYEILTGQPPFTGATALEVIGMVLTDPVRPVLERRKEAPPDLAAVAMRCLQKAPGQRYPSVELLAADVKAFQTGGLVGAYSYSTGIMLQRWARRHWPELATAAVALLMLAGVAAVAYAHVVQQNRALSAANRQLDLSKNRLLGYKLATESSQELGHSRTELASLLALEAGRYYKLSEAWMPDVAAALRDCLYAEPTCRELTGHTGQIRRLAFSPDGKLLATASEDTTIRLWDMTGSRNPTRVLRGHERGISCIAFHPSGKYLVSSSHDGTVRLWDLGIDKPIMTLSESEQPVWAVAYSPDGRWLASGSVDGTMRLWRTDQLDQPPHLLPGNTDSIQVVAFSPDGHFVFSGAGDGSLRRWEPAALDKPPLVLQAHEAAVMWIAFSPDGSQLCTTGADDRIRLWPTAALASASPAVLGSNTGDITGAAYSADGRQLVSVGMDEAIHFWSPGPDPRELRAIRGLKEGLWSVALSQDGKTLATSSDSKSVRLWDLQPRVSPTPVYSTGRRIRSLAYSKDGLLAGAGDDQLIHLWQPGATAPHQLPAQGQPSDPDWGGHQGTIQSLAFTPDGKRLISGSMDKAVRVWDLTQPPATATVLPSGMEWVRCVSVSPDGRLLAAGGGDTAVRLWTLADLKAPPRLLHGPTEEAMVALAFSPDSRRLAAGGGDSRIWLWDLEASGSEPPQALRGPQGVTMSLAFSHDGKWLAAGGSEQLVHLWRLDDPAAGPLELRGHTGDVLSLAFSADDALLVSASRDQTLRLWNMREPMSEPEVLRGHHSGVFSVVVAPNGREIASADGEGRVTIWPLSALDLVPYLAEVPQRNLSLAEWHKYVSGDIPYQRTVPGLPPGAEDEPAGRNRR